LYNPNDDEFISKEEYLEAKNNGVSTSLLRDRIRNLCWEKRRAITTPPRVNKRINLLELESLAKEHGISYDILRHRISRGWDEQEAATTPPILDAKEKFKGRTILRG